MNIGYSFIPVYNSNNDGKFLQYCKITFPPNEMSFLHRWVPPIKQPCHIVYCNPNEYFFLKQNETSSFINSLLSIETSHKIISHLVSQNEIDPVHIKLNWTFDIFSVQYNTLFEAWIISCFKKSNLNSNNSIY